MTENFWQLRHRPTVRRALLLLILFGVPLLLVKPLSQVGKNWRAGSYLKRAQTAMSRRDWEGARQETLRALKLKPDSPEICRLLAQIGDAREDAQRLALWSRVLQTGQATDADRLAFAEAALRENLVTLAQQQLNHLLGKSPPGKEAHLLAGLIALQQQRTVIARVDFQKALALDAAYAPAIIGLAQTELLLGQDPEAIRQGIRRLATLTSKPDENGLDALRILIAWGKQYVSLVPFDRALADQLKRHPSANIQDFCLATEWEISHLTDPKRIGFAVRKLTALAPRLSPKGQWELAIWLNRQGQYQQTLSAFPLDPRGPEELLLVQLDAVAALGQWTKLDEFLKNDLFATQPVLLWLFRARASRELKQAKPFEINWRRAINEAGPDPHSLGFLANYAETIGESARSAEAYELLSQQPGFEIDSLVKLVRIYEQLGQTRPLLGAIERLAAMQPNDLAFANDLAYLGLLINEPSGKSQERAQQVYTFNPRLPAFAATYALAQLKMGKPDVALRITNEFSPNTWTAPGWQAIRAAALAACGRKAEAVQVADKIDFKNLKPEEKLLLTSFWPPKTKPAKR